jgi:hypothetical protein
MKDANVNQIPELRVFANASSSFGNEMARLCHSGINECDEAYRAAEYLRNMVRRKVEAAQRALEQAQTALSNYESQEHKDKYGNSTYDASYAAHLRTAVEDARQKLSTAKDDEQQVLARYLQVRKEIESLIRSLSSAAYSVTAASSLVYKLVNSAAAILEMEYTNH